MKPSALISRTYELKGMTAELLLDRGPVRAPITANLELSPRPRLILEVVAAWTILVGFFIKDIEILPGHPTLGHSMEGLAMLFLFIPLMVLAIWVPRAIPSGDDWAVMPSTSVGVVFGIVISEPLRRFLGIMEIFLHIADLLRAAKLYPVRVPGYVLINGIVKTGEPEKPPISPSTDSLLGECRGPAAYALEELFNKLMVAEYRITLTDEEILAAELARPRQAIELCGSMTLPARP